MTSRHKLVTRPDAHPPGDVADYLVFQDQDALPATASGGEHWMTTTTSGVFIVDGSGVQIGPLGTISVDDGETSVSNAKELFLIAGVTVANGGSGVAELTATGVPGTVPASAAFSVPPTEAELETNLGDPAAHIGVAYALTSTTSGVRYLALSDGLRWPLTPLAVPLQGEGTFTLTSAPSGGTSLNMPKAAYYNGKTYFAYVKGTNGDVAIRSYTHSTGTVSAETVMHSALDIDTHAGPSVLVRSSDHRILAFYSAHNGTALYRWKSTNAEDISAGAELNLDSQLGGTVYTYPSTIELSDAIYLIVRPVEGAAGQSWSYSTSTDGGDTWAALTRFYGSSGRWGYLICCPNGDDRIDFFVTDGTQVHDTDVSLYHFYLTGGDFFTSDGTALTVPMHPADLTLVHDGSTDDTASIQTIAATSNRRPVVVYKTFPTATDCRYRWGRWTGREWLTYEVAADGSMGTDYSSGNAAIDETSPNVVVCSRKVSSQMEMFRYVTPDDGATWIEEQLTSGSTDPQVFPWFVRNHAPEFKVGWMSGSYTSATSYDVGFAANGAGQAALAATGLGRIIALVGTESAVEALTADTKEVLTSFSTDTSKVGYSTDLGSTWTWLGGSSTSVDEREVIVTGSGVDLAPLTNSAEDDWLYGIV